MHLLRVDVFPYKKSKFSSKIIGRTTAFGNDQLIIARGENRVGSIIILLSLNKNIYFSLFSFVFELLFVKR